MSHCGWVIETSTKYLAQYWTWQTCSFGELSISWLWTCLQWCTSMTRGGVLRKAKMEIRTQGSISVFDTLYVVDSQRSWYTHEDCWELDRSNAEEKCQQAGPQQPRLGAYYQMELEISLKSYKHVIMLGDSMGASAALLFSRLATSVLAFCPQVFSVAVFGVYVCAYLSIKPKLQVIGTHDHLPSGC